MKRVGAIFNPNRAPWLVLACSLMITFLFWRVEERMVSQQAEAHFLKENREIESAIAVRLHKYELMLQGCIGLFNASISVERNEWKAYVEAIDPHNNYPGIQGIGFAKRVTAAEKEAHIRQHRSEGFPDYSISPSADRAEYCPVIYLEPFSGRNLKLLGYDAYFDPVRRVCLEKSCSQGGAILSGKLKLMQETDQDMQNGFLLNVPVYEKNRPLNTAENRRAALFGFVYGAFRVNDFMKGIFENASDKIYWEIYDGRATGPDALLYRSGNAAPTASCLYEKKSELELFGRTWMLYFKTLPAFDAAIDRSRQFSIVLASLLISLLLFSITFFFVSRSKILAVEIIRRQKEQEALSLSEQKYRTIMDQAVDALFLNDKTGHILDVNRKACQSLGYSREELLAMTIADIDPEAFRDGNPKLWDKVFAGEQFSFEINQLRKDGSTFPAEMEVGLVRLPVGPAMLAIVRDITERRAAEEKIKRLKNLYATLSQCNQAIVHSASQEELFSTTCRNLVRLGGMQMAWIGLTDPGTHMVRPVANFGAGCEYLQNIEISVDAATPFGHGPVGSAIREQRPFWCQDFQYDPATAPWHERGAQVGWKASAALPLYRGGSVIGALTLYSGTKNVFDEEVSNLLVEISMDISYSLDKIAGETERKQADKALQESEKQFMNLSQQLEAILDHLPGLVFYKDKKNNYIRVNKYVALAHGKTKKDLEGKNLFDLYPKEDAEKYYQDDLAVINSGSAKLNIEERWETAEGVKWLNTSKIPFIAPSNEINGIIGISMDITERKQAEKELEARNDELTRFNYTVSHDLKSPLVTIKTFLGYLESDMAKADPERVAQDLGFIHTAADKMNNLLNELLAMSRVGRVVNPAVEAPLQDIVQEVLALVAGRITERGVRVQVTQEPVLLYGDRVRLVEVFQNLIDNAVKFMGEQSEPLIEIGAEEKNGLSFFFVRDNGMGIDTRYKDKLFGLFEKLNPDMEGTGLGLALVKRIIELHGGKIWFESEGQGKGACFWFTLPGKNPVSA